LVCRDIFALLISPPALLLAVLWQSYRGADCED
jgi:hypothetical protein